MNWNVIKSKRELLHVNFYADILSYWRRTWLAAKCQLHVASNGLHAPCVCVPLIVSILYQTHSLLSERLLASSFYPIIAISPALATVFQRFIHRTIFVRPLISLVNSEQRLLCALYWRGKNRVSGDQLLGKEMVSKSRYRYVCYLN